ncbi:MAG TPA: cell envelope integrity protein TolA [Pseudomonadales bacterium]|nr:cell envelope integrity protein TolA [Pseudomonadales bacterium]
MSDNRDEPLYRPIGLSVGMHLALAAIMTVSWYWHAEQKTMTPPAMMKASLVYAPKSTMAPQQKTQTQKPEKPQPKPEPPKPEPEPPKPEVVKPKEVKPEIKPTDKPSPIAAKPEQPKPKPQPEQKKQPDKKVEPPKPDAKQAEKKQAALSAIEKEKARKDAEMAIQALLNDEDITRTGELTDDELGKWAGLISSRIEDNWSRPPNARRGMKVLLAIELSSNGQVLNVTVVEGSGNKAFDLAAEAAVRKVERFEEITQMKPEVFDKNFRKFSLLFNPEDLFE